MNEHKSCPSHCCIKHGCKYGYNDCPVETGVTKQTGPCEECGLWSEGYYGDREPVDYDLYISPGVRRSRTPDERLAALAHAYFDAIDGHDHPMDEEVFALIEALRKKFGV